MSSWAHVRGFLCSVQSAPPIPLSHSLHRLGHYWIVRDGFGGHVIHGLHQTFIPASNSTTDRGERPDSKGQWIESRQSVTSNPMNGKQTWSTTLIKPPPLLLPTIPGPLTVNYLCKLPERFDRPGCCGAHVFMGPCPWLSLLCPECSPYSIAS